jgi:hypothetical protein
MEDEMIQETIKAIKENFLNSEWKKSLYSIINLVSEPNLSDIEWYESCTGKKPSKRVLKPIKNNYEEWPENWRIIYFAKRLWKTRVKTYFKDLGVRFEEVRQTLFKLTKKLLKKPWECANRLLNPPCNYPIYLSKGLAKKMIGNGYVIYNLITCK